VKDHLSDLLFCPTQTSIDNLAREGVTKGVHLVGDVMMDALEYNRSIAEEKSDIIDRLGFRDRLYIVLTIHRAANTDSRENMANILSAIDKSGKLRSSRSTRGRGSICRIMTYGMPCHLIFISLNRWAIST